MNEKQNFPKDNKENLDIWMDKAKLYASREHKINLPDDHEFWDVVRSYWNRNIDPENSCKECDSILFLKINSIL